MGSDTLEKLGFHEILNAGGHYTVMGGSRPTPSVLRCMNEAAKYWIDMKELQVHAGELLQKYLGCEDGVVTAGAYAANVIATEVALYEGRQRNSSLLTPNVLIQRSHVTKYAHSFETSGVRLKEIQRKNMDESLSDYIDKSTIALIYVLNESEFEFSLRETIETGRSADLPVLVDAAIVDPPVKGITEVLAYNPDFVSVSGGKGFNGPNASGILIGKKNVLSRARELAFPNYGPARGMKVSKEQIAGLIEAIREARERDEEKEILAWKKNIATIEKAIADLQGIRLEVIFPWRLNFPQPVPRLVINIEKPEGASLAEKIRSDLLRGKPCVFTRPLDQIEGPRNKIVIDARVLSKNEVATVAARLRSNLIRHLR